MRNTLALIAGMITGSFTGLEDALGRELEAVMLLMPVVLALAIFFYFEVLRRGERAAAFSPEGI